jgi:apolipoprotein N-acyltransferase
VALSRGTAAVPPTHVIWPETAVPFFLANDVLARGEAVRAVPEGGALITGSVRSTFHTQTRQLHNAMLVIDGAANIQQVYDKSHLVPFGEYVPLRGFLPVEKIVPGQGDFTPGPGRELLRIAGLPPASPLICYEAIFPGWVTPRDERPGWLLNITNDAWFGNFAGPRQHFAIVATRAVEEGLPMVRAANTGISAVVDPYGRVRARLGIGVEGVLDSGLPQALSPTFYARWGDLIPMNLGFALIVLGWVLGRRRDTA